MTKGDIQLLYEYDRWANTRVLQAVSALSDAHIIAGEWSWLAYWKEPSPDSTSLADLRKRRDARFHPDNFPSPAAIKQAWAEVEKEQIEFVDPLTEADLTKMLPARETQIAHLMQHVANHSTYHRGQIALMMRQLGAKPEATDFHVFLAEGRETGGAH